MQDNGKVVEDRTMVRLLRPDNPDTMSTRNFCELSCK